MVDQSGSTILFKVFINELNDGAEHSLIKFADDTNLGRGISQKNLNKEKNLNKHQILNWCQYVSGNEHIMEKNNDEDGHLTNRDRDKAEVFNAFFASVSNTDDGPREFQWHELEDQGYGNGLLVVNPKIVQDLLL
ncbi:hypothetical protein DUI87_09127 [Hirundo rustica rustica]|uniref:Reverse transcriptase domain-containing protein n=1 Tax=Hirundo rustica rustica TaxID=333673 RepID=A0A3M0KTG3_HIRRU|nr:hypothetical protein DUI87_09127 [Hirundo rustica rustica]